MAQGVKYAIMYLILIGITKLLQITAFDAKQYDKNKEESFAKSYPDSLVKKNEVAPDTTQIDSIRSNTAKTSLPVSGQDRDSIPKTSAQYAETSSDPFSEDTPVNTLSLEDLKSSYLAPILAKLPLGQLRDDMVIRYYRHEKDSEKVYQLRDLGYYIHEKEATETAGMGSNVIYYGDGVNINDIYIVALMLLESGIPLKSIIHTKYAWKDNAIEIGTDSSLINVPTMTVGDINSFHK